MSDDSLISDKTSSLSLEDQTGCTQPAIATNDRGPLQALVEDAEPKIVIESFSGQLLDQSFFVQIWKLEESYFVWIGAGNDEATLSNLSLAMTTRYNSIPLVTTLLGADDMESQQVAQRISLKSGSHVYTSYNLPDTPSLSAYVEKQVIVKLNSMK